MLHIKCVDRDRGKYSATSLRLYLKKANPDKNHPLVLILTIFFNIQLQMDYGTLLHKTM